MGLFRTADVGFVTPLRDGMNLVAKEYVAAQDPEDPGVLVLSRFAGAARELTSALIVNPYDCVGMAEALDRALSMPLAERKDRYEHLMRAIRAADLDAIWMPGATTSCVTCARSSPSPAPRSSRRKNSSSRTDRPREPALLVKGQAGS